MTRIIRTNSSKLAEILKKYESKGISGIMKGAKPIFWSRAAGMDVEDVDGNYYLDFTSSFGVQSLGHNHPQIVLALKEQIEKLIYSMPGIFPHEPYLDALSSISNFFGRWDDSQVILTNTGSDAVELALKLSYRQNKKPGFICFNGSYHGQTLGALSVTQIRNLKYPLNEILYRNTHSIDYPVLLKENSDDKTALEKMWETIEGLIIKHKRSKNEIGAIILEPIQNAAGYKVPENGFLRTIRTLCDQHGLNMIADEVFTGGGRTGHVLSVDRENVIPDIICVGKSITGGVASGACLANPEIMSSFFVEDPIPLHSSTFFNNPLACVAIKTSISIIEEHNLVTASAEIGSDLKVRLKSILEKYDCIKEIRGMGLAITIEFRDADGIGSKIAMNFSNMLLEKGIITLTSGLPYFNCVSICPPFIVDENHVVKLLLQIETVARELLKEC